MVFILLEIGEEYIREILCEQGRHERDLALVGLKPSSVGIAEYEFNMCNLFRSFCWSIITESSLSATAEVTWLLSILPSRFTCKHLIYRI
jgi:hypothetical protein